MDRLNREQYRASRADTGVNLVLAGAGTGKTKTLVEKVKSVIRYLSIDPENILILTFSRKAAEEIKERVAYGVGEKGNGVVSGTFHSFCLDLLRRNREVFTKAYGFKRFPSVIEEDEKENLFFQLIYPELNRFMGLPAGVIYDLIMRIDNISDRTLKKLEESGLIDELHSIIEKYNKHKIESSLLDFNDMMLFTINLLKNNKELRSGILSQFKYIFVDEFQDTSVNNFELLNLLLPDEGRNFFAVGDDWQSIYGFRNARIEYIVKMKKNFSEVTVHKLKVNYRSRKEIVKISSRFIRKNRYRTRKFLTSFKGKGGRVCFYNVKGFHEEAELIKGIIDDEKESSSSIAVLFRNNWQGDYLRERLCPDPEARGRINLMTMHSSKGLEFDTVIIIGVSDKIIPDKASDIEEERRLFYVALTRARERLYIISHLNDRGEISRFGMELGMKKRD